MTSSSAAFDEEPRVVLGADILSETMANKDVFGLVGKPLLGRYQVLSVIGSGGQAVVYEAEQVGLKRHVAVKLLLLNELPDDERASGLKRFQQEAEILASLSHP